LTVGYLVGHLERRNAVDGLALDPHDFATGRQDRHARAQAHQGIDQGCHRLDQVLAIVEHEQEVPVADAGRERLGGDPLAAKLQSQRAGHRGGNESGVGKRRQLDEPRPILEVGEQVADGLHGERGLSDPARPGQCHHPIGGHEIMHALHRQRPTNQPGDDQREICRRLCRWRARQKRGQRFGRLGVPGLPVPDQSVAAAR
jgi:hypothetical protein